MNVREIQAGTAAPPDFKPSGRSWPTVICLLVNKDNNMHVQPRNHRHIKYLGRQLQQLPPLNQTFVECKTQKRYGSENTTKLGFRPNTKLNRLNEQGEIHVIPTLNLRTVQKQSFLQCNHNVTLKQNPYTQVYNKQM